MIWWSKYVLICWYMLVLCLAVVVVNANTKKKDVPSTIWNFPTKSPTGMKYVALTFDDGPHGTLTPRLLDYLAKLSNVKVTFFVMGIKVHLHPQVLQRMVLEGHEVANHAWNHPVLSKLPFEEVQYQLNITSEALYNITGKYPKVMRPPYGNTNQKLNQRILHESDLPSIIWSIDTMDWKRPGRDEIVQRIVNKAVSGSVVLCHDIHPDTVEAIPIAVKQLQDKGFIFKTISELIDMYYYPVKT